MLFAPVARRSRRARVNNRPVHEGDAVTGALMTVFNIAGDVARAAPPDGATGPAGDRLILDVSGVTAAQGSASRSAASASLAVPVVS